MADSVVPVCIFIMLSLLNYRIISACVSESTRWPLFSSYYILLWILEVIICYWMLALGNDKDFQITSFLYGIYILLLYMSAPLAIVAMALLYFLAGLLRYLTYDRQLKKAEEQGNNTDQ